MAIDILEIHEEEGSIERIDFEIGRDEFDELIQSIKDRLEDNFGEDEVVVIREGERNPVIKGPPDSKIYLKYTSDGCHATFKLAHSVAADAAIRVMMDMGEGGRRGDASMSEIGERRVEQHVEEVKDDIGGTLDEGLESQAEQFAQDVSKPDRRRVGDTEEREVKDEEVEVFSDGSIRFTPPFNKTEASYKSRRSQDFGGGHKRCRDCAHYIEGGGCKMVEGEIHPDDYCEELFADIGIFGHKHEGYVEENLIVWGEEFNWSIEDAKEFAADLRERIESRIRGEK